MKINWDLIMQPMTVVHCDTEDKANELLAEAHKRDLIWRNGGSYLNNNCYNFHKSETCYDFNNRDFGSYTFCKNANYKILSYDNILIKEENKMKIKYDLQVFYNIVLFKILEMDEKYRSTDKDEILFTSSNGITIRSFNSIKLYENEIYVLGRVKHRDCEAEYYRFESNQEAQSYADKIRFALEEWNNHVEVMEIEYSYEYFNSKKIFSNSNYSLHFTKNPYYTQISIYINDGFINSYIANSRYIPLDKTITMFNRDCELLNIPFRIKGEN